MAVKRRKKKLIKPKFELPKEKSSIHTDMQDYCLLVYGEKKIGKTSMMSYFPNTIFGMCEPGGKSLEIYQTPIRNWSDMRQFVDAVCKDTFFKTVVIDTADYAYEYCMEHVCKELVIDHPSDEGYGKGWNAVKTEFTKQISKLLHSGKGVIFISHSKEQEIKSRSGGSYDKITSSMSKQAKDVLEGLVDIWVNYSYDGNRRFLYIQGNDSIDAGHRLKDNFKYADGKPIDRIPMGNSPEESYRNFIAAFNNDLASVKTKKPVNKKKLTLKKRRK